MPDTSTVVLLGRLSDPTDLPDQPVISAITLAELSVGPLVAQTAAERSARQAHPQRAEADVDPLPSDALIAATALAEGLPLVTCNPDDVRHTPRPGGRPDTHLSVLSTGAT